MTSQWTIRTDKRFLSTQWRASCTCPPPACLTPDPRNSGVTVNDVTLQTRCSVFVVNTVNFIRLFLSATARFLLAWLFNVSAAVLVFRFTTFSWTFPLASRHLQTFFVWRGSYDFCMAKFAFPCRRSRILKSPVRPRQCRGSMSANVVRLSSTSAELSAAVDGPGCSTSTRTLSGSLAISAVGSWSSWWSEILVNSMSEVSWIQARQRLPAPWNMPQNLTG